MDRIPACRQAGKFPKLLIQVVYMFFVYAIQSLKDRRIYVGMTANTAKRLAEHNAGKTRSTKGYTPWILFHQECVNSRAEARAREKYLKSGTGKEFLKSLLAP